MNNTNNNSKLIGGNKYETIKREANNKNKSLNISNDNTLVLHSIPNNSSDKRQNQIIINNTKTCRKPIIHYNITNNNMPASKLTTKNKLRFERNILYNKYASDSSITFNKMLLIVHSHPIVITAKTK